VDFQRQGKVTEKNRSGQGSVRERPASEEQAVPCTRFYTPAAYMTVPHLGCLFLKCRARTTSLDILAIGQLDLLLRFLDASYETLDLFRITELGTQRMKANGWSPQERDHWSYSWTDQIFRSVECGGNLPNFSGFYSH